MTTGMVREQNMENHIEKQMGCMAGFLHIFDRHQTLSGKRVSSSKRLPPSSPKAAVSSPEPEKHGESPAESTPSLGTETQSSTPETTTHQAKIPPSPPSFESKEGARSSRKFSREAPRLSLDSRAVVDARGSLHPREIRTNKATLLTNLSENEIHGDGTESDGDKQRRSTSVIAKLMGLDPLPDSDSDPETVKKAELRRSASESRVSGDLPQYRFFDGNNFQLKMLKHHSSSPGNISSNAAEDNRVSNGRNVDSNGFAVRNGKTEPAKASRRVRGIGQKKSFYDSADFFPEPKLNVSVYGEIEKRLKMRGIDEPSKDLETLKQILDALQLKGLLHSKKSTTSPRSSHRNFVLDGTNSVNESPIVVMKPARSSGSLNRTGRTGFDSPPSSGSWLSPRSRRNNDTLLIWSQRRDRSEIDSIRTQSQARARNSSSPTRSERSVSSPNRIRNPTHLETQRKVIDGVDSRRVSPVHSPKISWRKNAANQELASQSPRMRKTTSQRYHKEDKEVTVEAGDELSTVSEGSFSTSSQTDTERYKMEEHREGRILLERCDKLMNSIAEITATELQPSPVSVLDSSFYKEEPCSPSPVMKRSIDYKDQAGESKDDVWSAALCYSEEAKSEDCDFVYLSEILRASNYLPEDIDIFMLLEKQQRLKGNDTSKASTLRRRLIFDTVREILKRNRLLPPWKAARVEKKTLLERIWSEFRRIGEREESEDLFEVICGVLRKDLAEEGVKGWGWGKCAVEIGDMVLDIERLVFKDLIGETIRDLVECAGKCNRVSSLRRKLMF